MPYQILLQGFRLQHGGVFPPSDKDEMISKCKAINPAVSNVSRSAPSRPRIATLSHDYEVIFLDTTNISHASQMPFSIFGVAPLLFVLSKEGLTQKRRIQKASQPENIPFIPKTTRVCTHTAVCLIVLYLNVPY